MQKLRWMLTSALLAAVLTIGLLFGVADAQSRMRVGQLIAANITSLTGITIASGGLTVTAGNVAVTAGDLTLAAGSVTAGNDLIATDDATVGDALNTYDLITTKPTVIVVTDGSTITPLGSYVAISSSASTGTSAIAGCASGTAGWRITAVNQANTTITITDTGTIKASGNAALGQYDSWSAMCDGTNWIETSEANN